jgi:hypothetical protein
MWSRVYKYVAINLHDIANIYGISIKLNVWNSLLVKTMLLLQRIYAVLIKTLKCNEQNVVN